MLFNSLTFVVFFAVVLTAYWSMRSWNARKNLLVVASYVFYGAWKPPIRRPALFHDGNGFLAWQTNRQGQRTPFAPRPVGWQRLHESEHARVFQIWELSPAKFSVAARAHRHHLPTAASRHSSARRHFLLHVPFSLLHARHLSRRAAADQIAP